MSENGKRNEILNAADSCTGFNALNHRLRTKQLITVCSSTITVVCKFSAGSSPIDQTVMDQCL